VKAKKAAKVLKSQDERFARIGGVTQKEWLDSSDRVQLVLAAGTRAAKAARGRYDEAVTGVDPVKLAKEVGRELRKQVPQGPTPDERLDAYLARKAAYGDRAAANLLEQRGGQPAWQVRQDAELRKGSQSGEMHHLAESVIEGLEAKSMAEHQRREQLRKQGWSR
jgi:hypothetical protein